MRATEFLASRVVDPAGARLGPVRDVYVTKEEDGFRVVGLVIGGGFLAGLAHGWGFVAGRASAPWLFRRLTSAARAQARFVPAEHVSSWGPGEIQIGVTVRELPHVDEALPR